MTATINSTIEKFGYPSTLLRDYRHWVLLLRPAQVTAGSLIGGASLGPEKALGSLGGGAGSSPECQQSGAVSVRRRSG